MYEAGAKRAFDLAAASLALLALAPVFLAVAVAVLLALGRPVLFTQRRAGRGGAPFAILKFRSMAPGDAPDAARLTRFGQRLRASGLDELPQLILREILLESSLRSDDPISIKTMFLPGRTPSNKNRHRKHCTGQMPSPLQSIDPFHRILNDIQYKPG